jgi:superfamily II DNA or RNA helicase
VNPSDYKTKDSSEQLVLHQVAFIDAVFNPASKRVVVLRGDVGLGKSFALVVLASRMLRERTTARVLFLVPGVLRAQFVEMLREAGTPTLPVDRYQFREMLDSTTGGEHWPAGVAVVMSREFARQEDIRAALTTVRRDLLIVNEAHQFRGTLAGQLVHQIGEESDRVVLSTLPNLELPEAFREDNATVVQWRRDRVVAYDGTLLDAKPRPILRDFFSAYLQPS